MRILQIGGDSEIPVGSVPVINRDRIDDRRAVQYQANIVYVEMACQRTDDPYSGRESKNAEDEQSHGAR